MRAICYTAPGYGMYELPKPKMIHADDVIIRPAYIGICGSDINTIKGFEDKHNAQISPGKIYQLGHEASGYVEELGPKATAKGLKVGDKVVMYYNRHCGKCYYCRNGQEHFCSNMETRAGSMADYIAQNEQQVFKLPEDADMAKAALTEPISVVLRGVEMMRIKPGASVAISGGGGIGLLFLQLINLLGGCRVTVLEPVASKRDIALKYGAEYVLDPLSPDAVAQGMDITEGRGFDYVVETSGAVPAIQTCYDIGGRGSTLELFACYPNNEYYRLSLDSFFMKEVTMLSVFQSPYMYPRAIEMAKKLDLEPFIQHIYDPDQWQEAFEYRLTGEPLKVMFRFANK